MLIILNTDIIHLGSETALWITCQKSQYLCKVFYYYLTTLQIGRLAAINMLAAILHVRVTL